MLTQMASSLNETALAHNLLYQVHCSQKTRMVCLDYQSHIDMYIPSVINMLASKGTSSSVAR